VTNTIGSVREQEINTEEDIPPAVGVGWRGRKQKIRGTERGWH
jgi:hypothetical protein